MINDQSRRDFLKTTTAVAGAALLAPALAEAAEPPAITAQKATDRVKVGATGVTPTFLAQGCGYNGTARSSDHTRMGTEAFERLLRRGLEQGIRFIDTADLYGTHSYLRPVLRSVPRESFAVLSKIWPRREYWNLFSGGATEEVNRYRRELGVDMLDICLIHCMQNAKWADEYARVCDELAQLKDKKVVRAVGVSCHDLGALKVASTSPWVDVIFARINNKGGGNYMMDGSLEEVVPVLKTARANGKFVVGMKIFAAGKLIKPEEKDASLHYVISNRLVDAITVGMKKAEEVDDTLARVNAALKG